MEELSIAAFLCDGDGRLRALSPCAETLLASGEHLKLQDRRLTTCSDTDASNFAAAFAAAVTARASPRGLPPTVLMLNSANGAEPLLVEVECLCEERHEAGGSVATLVVVRAPRGADSRVALLAKSLFGLTQAEAVVAARLAAGCNAQAVADETHVSVGTVRTHIRHIFRKARVRSQIEFVAALTARL